MLVVGILEDEPDIRNMMRLQLQMEGYHTQEMPTSSPSLLRKKTWEGIDIAVVDLMMPFVGGNEVIKFLQQELPNIRRVAVSASKGSLDEVMAYADAAVLKPYTLHEFIGAIDGTG